MSDLVTVKVLRAHANGYGDAHEKAVGDGYALPASAAQLLVNEGLVEVSDGDKVQIRGRQGTRKSTGADREGSDQESIVEPGT